MAIFLRNRQGAEVCNLLEFHLTRGLQLESRLARGLPLESRLARPGPLESRLLRAILSESRFARLAKRKTDRFSPTERDFGRNFPRQTQKRQDSGGQP